jgi:hypothetical protein
MPIQGERTCLRCGCPHGCLRRRQGSDDGLLRGRAADALGFAELRCLCIGLQRFQGLSLLSGGGDLLVAQRVEPEHPVVADGVGGLAVGMAATVPDVGVAVAVHLAKDVAIALALQLGAGAARVLRVVLAAVDEVPLGARVGRLVGLGDLGELVVAAVANDAGDQVLVFPAEAADEGGAVGAAEDEDAPRIERVVVAGPGDQAQHALVIVLRPAGPLRLAADDDVLIAEAEALERRQRQADVVVFVAVVTVEEDEQAEVLSGGQLLRRLHVDAHDDVLLHGVGDVPLEPALGRGGFVVAPAGVDCQCAEEDRYRPKTPRLPPVHVRSFRCGEGCCLRQG